MRVFIGLQRQLRAQDCFERELRSFELSSLRVCLGEGCCCDGVVLCDLRIARNTTTPEYVGVPAWWLGIARPQQSQLLRQEDTSPCVGSPRPSGYGVCVHD